MNPFDIQVQRAAPKQTKRVPKRGGRPKKARAVSTQTAVQPFGPQTTAQPSRFGPGGDILSSTFQRLYGGFDPRLLGIANLGASLTPMWSQQKPPQLPWQNPQTTFGQGFTMREPGPGRSLVPHQAGRPGWTAEEAAMARGAPARALVPRGGTLPAVQRGPGIYGPGIGGAEAWTMGAGTPPVRPPVPTLNPLVAAGLLAASPTYQRLRHGEILPGTPSFRIGGQPQGVPPSAQEMPAQLTGQPQQQVAPQAAPAAPAGLPTPFQQQPDEMAEAQMALARARAAYEESERAYQQMAGPGAQPRLDQTTAAQPFSPIPQAAGPAGTYHGLPIMSEGSTGAGGIWPSTIRKLEEFDAQQAAGGPPPQAQMGLQPPMASDADLLTLQQERGGVSKYASSQINPFTGEIQQLDPNRPTLPVGGLADRDPRMARQEAEDQLYKALMQTQQPERFYNAQTWYQNELDKMRAMDESGEPVYPEAFVSGLEDRPEVAREIARRRMISDYTAQPRGTTMIGRATGLDAEQIRRERYAGTADRPGTKQRRAEERGRLPGVRAAKERDMMQEILRGGGEGGDFARDDRMYGREVALARAEMRNRLAIAQVGGKENELQTAIQTAEFADILARRQKALEADDNVELAEVQKEYDRFIAKQQPTVPGWPGGGDAPSGEAPNIPGFQARQPTAEEFKILEEEAAATANWGMAEDWSMNPWSESFGRGASEFVARAVARRVPKDMAWAWVFKRREEERAKKRDQAEAEVKSILRGGSAPDNPFVGRFQ